MEKLWITILMNGVTVSMTYSRRNPAIYYFTDKIVESNRPNKKIFKGVKGNSLPTSKFSIEWVLCRTLVFVKFARYNYIVGMK